MKLHLVALVISLVFYTLPNNIDTALAKVINNDIMIKQTGVASWYGPNFHGKKTASGNTYNQFDYTAAHPKLPMYSIAKVSNLENNKSVFVLINDRGPYMDKSYNRIIDLSRKAADELKIVEKGTADVKVEFMYNHTQKVLAKLSRNQRRSESQISTAMLKHIATLNSKARIST